MFKCETHFHKWGRVQGMEPNDSQVHFHFGSYTFVGIANVQSLGWKRQANTKLGPHDTIRKVLKHGYLKCARVFHLDLILHEL